MKRSFALVLTSSRTAAAVATALALWFTNGFAPGALAGGSMREVAIHDPVLNEDAYTLSVPATWVFDGAVIQGSSCLGLPFAVIRAQSPDGLTGVKSLPRLDWAWSDRPGPAASHGDCLPYAKELSAAQVLTYMTGVLHVRYVRSAPTPDLAAFRARIEANGGGLTTSHGDKAAAFVRYSINRIAIDERIDVTTDCMTSTLAIVGRTHACFAFVTRARAPLGRWSQATFDPIVRSLHVDPAWQQNFVTAMNARIQRSGQAVLAAGADGARLREASANAFDQAQGMRQQQHEQFMASMQRGTDLSMARSSESADTNHRLAGDWADYALDQQKRLDPNTGEISKDSSAYSYTWVNESGRRIQTNNVNENPNGNGTGSWTLQENVR